MKICSGCKIEKPESDYYRKGSGYQDRCKVCKKKYGASWYVKNSEKHRAKVKLISDEVYKRQRAIVDEAKSVPCKDCSRSFSPWQMDFDHLSDKEGDIASMVGRCSDKRLLDEIAKCEVTCATCHRDRTYKRTYKRNNAN